ncbi:MAG TPA: carboxylesterase/lipase family protein [Caulobacterales bacterium]|jgi:para-nitrobenzyl esterase|nr:carboxylesterase/lipase family protein [Caulobacterales bacterium]
MSERRNLNAAQHPSRRALIGYGAGAIAAGALAGCGPRAIERQSPALGGAPIASTAFGDVRGDIDDGVSVFRGIRYGAPTERFMPPKPPAPWKQAQDALDFAAQAPEAFGPPTSLYRSWANARPASEDCLFLNVWTPALDGARRPVMVWLHGIGFSTGSGASRVFDGTRLCRHGDVVVVTLNYRVNILGHLYLSRLAPEYADSGNVGLMDIVLALNWVHDNIAAFGGDPGNVTLLGESVGGEKVTALMGMASAQGLFHRAVVQSGAGVYRLASADEAAENTLKALDWLGIPPARARELKSVPIEELIAVMSWAPMRPVVDGRSLSMSPFDPDAPAISAQIPMLVGTVKDEMTVLTGRNDPSVFSLSWAEVSARLAKMRVPAAHYLDAYRRLYPRATPSELFFRLLTDVTYWRGATELAERKTAQNGAPAFMYQLNWETPIDGGKWGAPHGLDLPLTLDNVARSASMIGAAPQEKAAAQILADQMSAAWIAFARTGNPNNAALPNWPAYDAQTRATMMFDTKSYVENDPRRAARLTVSAPLNAS